MKTVAIEKKLDNWKIENERTYFWSMRSTDIKIESLTRASSHLS